MRTTTLSATAKSRHALRSGTLYLITWENSIDQVVGKDQGSFVRQPTAMTEEHRRAIFKRKEMKINFECKKCGDIFDSDVGAVSISEDSFRPQFENEIICPKCGQRSIDGVLLTELIVPTNSTQEKSKKKAANAANIMDI